MVSLKDVQLPGKSATINCVSVPTRGGSGYYQNTDGSTIAEGSKLIITRIVDCEPR